MSSLFATSLRVSISSALVTLILGVIPANGTVLRFATLIAPLLNPFLADWAALKHGLSASDVTTLLVQTCLFAAFIFLPTVAQSVDRRCGSVMTIFIARSLAPLLCILTDKTRSRRKFLLALLCFASTAITLAPLNECSLPERIVNHTFGRAIGAQLLVLLSVVCFVTHAESEKAHGSMWIETAVIISALSAPYSDLSALVFQDVWVRFAVVLLLAWFSARSLHNLKVLLEYSPLGVAFSLVQTQALSMLINAAGTPSMEMVALGSLITFVVSYFGMRSNFVQRSEE